MITKNRGRGRDRNEDGGHRSKSKHQSKSKCKWKTFECNYCGKKGHLQKYCYKLKNDNKDKQEKNNDENGNCVATITGNDLVIVYDENLINVACDDSGWVIDSGASFHVTSRKDFFSSYTLGDFGVLKMGNNDTSKVVGIGTVCLETSNRTKLILKNVRHAPDICLHLISTSVLNDVVIVIPLVVHNGTSLRVLWLWPMVSNFLVCIS